MSRRARITLTPEPEVNSEPNQATETAALPETEAHPHDGLSAAADNPASPSAPAKRSLSVGTIFKAALAGLAVASVLLLWKNRKL